MAKSNRKSAVSAAVSDRVLTPQRRSHGAVHRLRFGEEIFDVDGVKSRPYIVRDILDALESSGKIDRDMRAAGQKFRDAFDRANLEAMRCPDVGRVPGLGRSTDDPTSVIAAKKEVARMVAQVGWRPGGSCLWHVLGLQMSLRDWAGSLEWGGGPCHPMSASGILVAALGTLAA